MDLVKWCHEHCSPHSEDENSHPEKQRKATAKNEQKHKLKEEKSVKPALDMIQMHFPLHTARKQQQKCQKDIADPSKQEKRLYKEPQSCETRASWGEGVPYGSTPHFNSCPAARQSDERIA